MKHEAILAGDEFPPRDTRVDVGYDVNVHCEAGEIPAQLLNLSSDGFRLHTANPLEVGWEVTISQVPAARHSPKMMPTKNPTTKKLQNPTHSQNFPGVS